MNLLRKCLLPLAGVAAVLFIISIASPRAVQAITAALVKNVDEPGRTPWETRSAFLPNAGGCFGGTDCLNYTDGPQYAIFDLRPIPAGKRWIVQSATGGLVNGTGRTNNITLSNTRSAVIFDGQRWAFGGPFGAGVDFGAVIFSEKLYAAFGPGETPTVRVTASPSLNGYTVIVFSGYLIDAN